MSAPATRVVDAPLVAPSGGSGLIEVFRRRYLLKLLVRREISARYQGSLLGMLWSYLNPLSQLFLFWFVMGKIVGMDKRAENFAIHVFCGLIVVYFFTETFNAGTRSIVRNKALVKKMAMPREMFPVASMLVSAFHLIPQLILLVGIILLQGWQPDPYGLACGVLGLLVIMVIGTSLALMFSAANVLFRDVGQGVAILTNFVRFSVPMIYPYTLVEERFGDLARFYLWNPVAEAVLLMQRCFWAGTTSDVDLTLATHFPTRLLERGLAAFAVGLVMLAIGQMVFSRLENRIPERI